MRVLLLDCHSLLFRAFYALPELTTSTGEPSGALYGFSMLLLKLLREEQPGGVALARDLPGKTFRHEQYDGYKAGRAKAPSPLVQQLARFDELVGALGFPMLAAPGFEADDVLATLATRFGERGDDVVVVSGDRDLFQLASARCQILFLGQRGKPPVRYDLAAVEQRFGIPPERLPGYVALVGDSSDNIPKVKGIGGATASQLMRRYATAAELLDHVSEVEPLRIRALLEQHAAQIRASEQLVRLRRDVPLPDVTPRALDVEARSRTRAFFEALELKSLLPRLDALA
jgi:DNA polymerase-1